MGQSRGQEALACEEAKPSEERSEGRGEEGGGEEGALSLPNASVKVPGRGAGALCKGVVSGVGVRLNGSGRVSHDWTAAW